MKKTLFTCIVLVFLTGIVAPHMLYAKGTYDIRLNLKAGDVYPIHLITSQIIEEEMFGIKLKLQQNIDSVYEYSIEEKLKDGSYSLISRIKNIKMDMKILEPEMPEDSDSMNSLFDSLFNQVFPLMEGCEFSLIVSETGEVLDSSGFEELMDQLFEKLSETADSPLPLDMKEMFKDKFGSDYLNNSWNIYFAYIPDHPVKIGETWEKAVTLSEKIPMRINNQYTLIEVTNDELVLALEATIETDENVELFSGMGMAVEFTITGNQTGEIRIDKKTYWITGMEIKQTVSGVITMGDENSTLKLEVPMKIETETRTQ